MGWLGKHFSWLNHVINPAKRFPLGVNFLLLDCFFVFFFSNSYHHVKPELHFLHPLSSSLGLSPPSETAHSPAASRQRVHGYARPCFSENILNLYSHLISNLASSRILPWNLCIYVWNLEGIHHRFLVCGWKVQSNSDIWSFTCDSVLAGSSRESHLCSWCSEIAQSRALGTSLFLSTALGPG